MSIEDKVVLITGAGQGIGRGIALRLAADGADIAIIDLNEAKMAEVADEVRRIGRKATTFVADVTKRDEVYAAVEHTESALDGFDVMINNAGIAQVNPIADVTEEEVAKILGGQRRRCALGHSGRCREIPAARSARQDHQRQLDRRP